MPLAHPAIPRICSEIRLWRAPKQPVRRKRIFFFSRRDWEECKPHIPEESSHSCHRIHDGRCSPNRYLPRISWEFPLSNEKRPWELWRLGHNWFRMLSLIKVLLNYVRAGPFENRGRINHLATVTMAEWCARLVGRIQPQLIFKPTTCTWSSICRHICCVIPVLDETVIIALEGQNVVKQSVITIWVVWLWLGDSDVTGWITKQEFSANDNRVKEITSWDYNYG